MPAGRRPDRGEVDGKDVRDEEAVANAIAERKPGDKVEIEYYRGDRRRP